MSTSWIPLFFATLQAQAYKLGRYVAAGSWCEVTLAEKVTFPDFDNLKNSSTTSFLLVNTILTNLDNATYGSGQFLLPSESPLQEISGYRAIYNDVVGCFEVSSHRDMAHIKQEPGSSNSTIFEQVCMQQYPSTISPVNTSKCSVPSASIEGSNYITAQYKHTNKTEPRLESAISVATEATRVHDILEGLSNTSTVSSAIHAQCSNATSASIEYYQSPTGCDWAEIMDDDDDSEVQAYYISPSGDDWATLNDAEEDNSSSTGAIDKVFNCPFTYEPTEDASSFITTSITSYFTSSDRDSDDECGSKRGATGSQIETTSTCCNDVDLPDLRQYIPQDLEAEYQATLEALSPNVQATSVGHRSVDWFWDIVSTGAIPPVGTQITCTPEQSPSVNDNHTNDLIINDDGRIHYPSASNIREVVDLPSPLRYVQNYEDDAGLDEASHTGSSMLSIPGILKVGTVTNETLQGEHEEQAWTKPDTSNADTATNTEDLNSGGMCGSDSKLGSRTPDLRKFIPEGTSAEFERELAKIRMDHLKVIDWRWMCEASKQLIAAGRGCRFQLEEADRSRDWFWTIANDARPEQIPLMSSSEIGTDIRPSKSQKWAQPAHHINFSGKTVYHKSDTTPATSYWLASSPSLKTRDHYNGSLRRTVLSHRAAEWVDPVVYSGGDIPEDLTGTAFQEHVNGMVEKVYLPYGLWQHEQLESHEDRPRSSDETVCLYCNCPDVNELPQLPLYDIAEEVAVVNDDGRFHPPKPSRKRPVVAGRSKLFMMYSKSDHPGPSTEAIILQETPLLCPVPLRLRRKSLALQPIYSIDTETSTSNDFVTQPTPIEDSYTVLPDAWADLYTMTRPEVCLNNRALMLETIIEEQFQCENESLPTSSQTGLTKKEIFERFLKIFSEFDDYDDFFLCEAETMSDKDEKTSLSAMPDHIGERSVLGDMTFSTPVSNLVKDVTREPLSENMASEVVKKILSGRPLNQFDLIPQQSFTAIFTGNGLLRPSASPTTSSPGVADEKLLIKVEAEFETEVVPKLLPTRKPSLQKTALRSFDGANSPCPDRILDTITYSIVFTGQMSSNLCTKPQYDVLESLLEPSSSAIATFEEELLYPSSLRIEKKVVTKSGEERAIAHDKQAQLSAWIEENSISSHFSTEWEDQESSNESCTDSEHKSSSSLSEIASNNPSLESTREPSCQGGSADDPLKKDGMVTQAMFDAVCISEKRMAALPEVMPIVRQALIDRAFSGPQSVSDEEDEDYDYQSDGEVEGQNTVIEDSFSEGESDVKLYLHDWVCDSSVSHDLITTIFSPTKVSAGAPARSNECSLYNCEICPMTHDADQALMVVGFVRENSIKTALIPELALTQSPTSQWGADLGKQPSLAVLTEVSVLKIEVSGPTAEQSAINTNVREAIGGSHEYFQAPKETPENQEGDDATAAKDEAKVFDRNPTTLNYTVEEEVAAPLAFDCDVGLSLPFPKLSDCLLYGSIAGYLGYRLFAALRR
ncbi:hypothetical protein MMC17_001588 [Xylographa soralifera]|nr:hypothetical protein [Xylographa soralifera]